MPKATQIATTLFMFLRENENLMQRVGMEGVKVGFDRDKLAKSAELYNIDLSRYLQMVSDYETKILQQQKRQRDSKS